MVGHIFLQDHNMMPLRSSQKFQAKALVLLIELPLAKIRAVGRMNYDTRNFQDAAGFDGTANRADRDARTFLIHRFKRVQARSMRKT